MKQITIYILFILLVSCNNSINNKEIENNKNDISISTEIKRINNKKELLQTKTKLNKMIVYSDSLIISLDSLNFTDSIIKKKFGDTLLFKALRNCECCFYPEYIIIEDEILYKIYLNDSTIGFIKDNNFAVNIQEYNIENYKIIIKQQCGDGFIWFDFPILLRNDTLIKRFRSFEFNSSELVFDSLLLFHHGYGLSVINPFSEKRSDLIKSHYIRSYNIDILNKKIFFLEVRNIGFDSHISIGEINIKTDSIQYLFNIKSDTIIAGIDGGETDYFNFKTKNDEAGSLFSFWVTKRDSPDTQQYITVDKDGNIIKIEHSD